jgi:hypothetical protein
MQGKYFRITQVADANNVIEGRSFENCWIYGPAVLFATEHTDVSANTFDANPSEVFIAVEPGTLVGRRTGIVIVKDCKFRRFPGPDFANTKPPSKCTRCWTCTATSPPLSALPMEKCMTSTSSTRFCRRPGNLRHGSRFRASLRLHAQFGIFRRTHEIQHLAPTPILASGRQEHGSSIRSHRHSHRVRLRQGVP